MSQRIEVSYGANEVLVWNVGEDFATRTGANEAQCGPVKLDQVVWKTLGFEKTAYMVLMEHMARQLFIARHGRMPN
jgi:hypothetical protein